MCNMLRNNCRSRLRETADADWRCAPAPVRRAPSDRPHWRFRRTAERAAIVPNHWRVAIWIFSCSSPSIHKLSHSPTIAQNRTSPESGFYRKECYAASAPIRNGNISLASSNSCVRRPAMRFSTSAVCTICSPSWAVQICAFSRNHSARMLARCSRDGLELILVTSKSEPRCGCTQRFAPVRVMPKVRSFP